MIDLLLQKEIQDFIIAHEHDDEKDLVLRQKTILGVASSLIAEQIIARRKAKTKIPLYYNARNIVYPPGINLEQSSSERTALLKPKILRSILAKTEILADLTGGFGIDSFFLSRVFKKIFFVDPNPHLISLAQHNHKTLNSFNIQYKNTTAKNFLAYTERVDCAFLDPSRRSKSNKKVFRFSDCEPNAASLLPDIFKKSDFVLIKAAPLLDIQRGIQELSAVEKVWVVSVDNECKELLFLCCKEFEGEPEIVAINLNDNPETFSFTLSEEKKEVATFSGPLSYIYEPNASILKAGAFKTIAVKFSVAKLHPNTHLYTSKKFTENFPGRVFKTIGEVKSDPKQVLKVFPDGKANVITRNYPLSTEELKKKTKLTDGGSLFLIGCSGQEKKYLLAAERIK